MSESVKELFQKIADEGMPHLEVGIVQSVSPIEIVLKSEAKILLHAKSLVIPRRIAERKKCLQNCMNTGEGCWDCCAPDPMKVGEELYLLALNKGSLYYVLDWK